MPSGIVNYDQNVMVGSFADASLLNAANSGLLEMFRLRKT